MCSLSTPFIRKDTKAFFFSECKSNMFFVQLQIIREKNTVSNKKNEPKTDIALIQTSKFMFFYCMTFINIL